MVPWNHARAEGVCLRPHRMTSRTSVGQRSTHKRRIDHSQVEEAEAHQGWNGMRVKNTNTEVAAMRIASHRAHDVSISRYLRPVVIQEFML